MAVSGQLELVQALQLACSQNPDELKVGERKLEGWKTQACYYSGLSVVFGDKSVEPAVRWMALTCIKNGVEQFWRPGAPNPISEEEKSQVRAVLLQSIEESVPQVFTQLSVLIARIARMDCPGNWPQLLPLLSEGVRSACEKSRKCYLQVMKKVLKELAGRRLPHHQKVFQEVTTGLLAYMLKLWRTHLEEGVALVARNEAQAARGTLELSHVCLKILRQMVVYGIPKFHGIVEALQFVDSLLEQVPQLALLRRQVTDDYEPIRLILESTINLHMKIVTELQSHQAIGFGSYVHRCLSLIHRLVFSSDSSSYLYESLLISCLNLFRLILRCEDYTPPKFEHMTESVLPPGIVEAHQAKLMFFTAETCSHILERLVGHYLLLTDEELALWTQEPESYDKEQPGDSTECSVRVCVQSAVVALVYDFQLTVAPCLVDLLRKVEVMDASNDTTSLRIKEAVYTAVGLCAFQLYDEFDYDTWYQTHLLKEINILEPGYQVIRYRVVWLLGQWVTVKMSSSLRPSLYSVVVPLMARSEHIAVRLAAKEVIKICVDDLDFKVEDFVPFLSACMSHLFQLLHDCKEVDSKMAVLNVLSLLVEIMGDAVQPHVGSILQALPGLWAESGEKNATVLRSVIMMTLTNITKSLQGTSAEMHEFTLPVIRLATDVKSEEHVYLAEDGLQLWLSTLLHCPSISPALMTLLDNMWGLLGVSEGDEEGGDAVPMAGLMDIGSENLLVCFSILESYTLLCSEQPESFQSCARLICRAGQYYLGDVKPTAEVAIVRVLARVVQLYSPVLVEPVLPRLLNKVLEETNPSVLTGCLTLVARVLIHHPLFFFSFLEKISTQTQRTAAEFFGLLMDVWSVSLDSIGQLQCRKLTGLAVSNLLPVADVCVTSRFDSLVNMCVDVLHDVMDYSNQNELYDTLVAGQAIEPSEGGSSIDTQQDIRERKLSQFDPLRCVSLHSHVTEKLEACLSVQGPEGYTSLINKVDVVVREQLLEFVPLKAAPHLLNISLQEIMAASETK